METHSQVRKYVSSVHQTEVTIIWYIKDTECAFGSILYSYFTPMFMDTILYIVFKHYGNLFMLPAIAVCEC